jgi:ankyrin repeat protein
VDKATSLHLAAAANGHCLTFSYLMEKATQKTPQTEYGCTPLHFAAKAGQLEICKLILSNIKEKNPTNYLRGTPISIAAKSRHMSLCIYLTCETLKTKLANIMTATPNFFL